MGSYLRDWRIIIRSTEWRVEAQDIVKADIYRWDRRCVNTAITSESSRSLAVSLLKALHDESKNVTKPEMEETFQWRCLHDRDYLRRATAAQAFAQSYEQNLVLEAFMEHLDVGAGFKWIDFMLTDDEPYGHKHCALRTTPARPIPLRP